MSTFWAFLHTFRFADPWLLLLLLLIPLWVWLRGRYSPVAAVQFSSSELLRSGSRKTRFAPHHLLAAFRYFALALLLVAFARPQVEKGLTDYDAKGINIMMALDFSGTMKRKDFMMNNKKVTRAEALIKVISEFMRVRAKDRVGLVRFDANAYLVSPLTLDHDWLIQRMTEEKTTRGTAPGSGMVIAAEHLLPATNQTKVIIVVTDAEQVNEGPDPGAVAKVLAQMKIKVHVIQVVDFKDMANGNQAWNDMAQVPKITGGQFFQVADFAGLRNVYRQIDLLEKSTFTEGKQRTYRELLPWFAIPALLLLMMELILSQTVWRRLP